MSPLHHRQSQGFPPGLVPSTAEKLRLKRAGAKNLSLYPITASDWMTLAVSHDAEAGLEVIHPGCWGNCPISAQRKGEGGLPQSRGLFCLPYWATPSQGRVLCSRDPRTLCSLCSPPPHLGYPEVPREDAGSPRKPKMVSLRPGLKVRITICLGARLAGELRSAAESPLRVALAPVSWSPR
ncbi:Hypothetical predicted protein, partial [Marmota monax]